MLAQQALPHGSDGAELVAHPLQLLVVLELEDWVPVVVDVLGIAQRGWPMGRAALSAWPRLRRGRHRKGGRGQSLANDLELVAEREQRRESHRGGVRLRCTRTSTIGVRFKQL